VPNQVIVPLLEYLFAHYGKRIALIGSDTLYAREINRIVKEFLGESGGRLVRESYSPFLTPATRFRTMARQFVDDGADAIISTVVGEDSVTLYNAFGEVERRGREIPIASLTTTESELAQVAPEARAGHLSALPYFGSMATPGNDAFVATFRRRYGAGAVPGVYSEVCHSLVHMFADAVRQTGETDTDAILPWLAQSVVRGPGGERAIDPENNHLVLRPMIGKSQADGTFEIVWTSPTAIRPDPYLIAYDRSLVA
jgi:branched-chain amino acid transport system substrate-binding protein